MSDMECLWTTGQHTVQTWMQNHEKKRKASMESIVVRRRNFSYVLPLFFFLKIVHPRPLFTLDYVYFKQTTIQQSNVEKCLSNIRCWDSNPRPSDHEFPPIITRPGLYAIYHFCFYIMEFSVYSGRSLCLFLVNFNKAILCQIIVKVYPSSIQHLGLYSWWWTTCKTAIPFANPINK